VEALRACGHQVELITYHVAEEDTDLDFPVHRLFNKRVHRAMPAGPSASKLFLYDALLAMKVWQVVARGGFDVIHAHHFEGLLASVPARLRHRVPLVYDAHTMLRLELPSYGPRLSHWIARTAGGWLDGMLPRGADHIVAVTPDIRDSLIERHGLSPERVTVVMNGVEAGTFRVEQAPSPDGAVRLIYSGTVAPYQDIDLLLEAFARARRVREDLRLSDNREWTKYRYGYLLWGRLLYNPDAEPETWRRHLRATYGERNLRVVATRLPEHPGAALERVYRGMLAANGA